MAPQRKRLGIAAGSAVQVPLDLPARDIMSLRRKMLEEPSSAFARRDASAFGDAPQYAPQVAGALDLDRNADQVDHTRDLLARVGTQQPGHTPYFSPANTGIAGPKGTRVRTRQLGVTSTPVGANANDEEAINKTEQAIDAGDPKNAPNSLDDGKDLDESSKSILLVVTVGAVLAAILVGFS